MATRSTQVADLHAEWFASWFDSAHYHRLYAHRDEAEAAGLIDRLMDRLRPVPGATAVDLGCGAGRHSRWLASHGLDVTGLDLSSASLDEARLSESPRLRFGRQDMRLPFGDEAFDFVFNLFTSFGYFQDPADHLKVVQNIARSLKTGGTLVLDYLNVSRAEALLVAQDLQERDGVRYQISRWADPGHIFKRIVIDDPHGGVQEHVERVAKLGLDDFRFMFELCGLSIAEVFGSYNLEPFDERTSSRLMLVARKPGNASSELPSRQVLTNTAECLWCHSEIRRQHRLRHPADDRGIDAQELEVAFFRSGTQ
jgi:SAM-dependent methyltransferase